MASSAGDGTGRPKKAFNPAATDTPGDGVDSDCDGDDDAVDDDPHDDDPDVGPFDSGLPIAGDGRTCGCGGAAPAGLLLAWLGLMGLVSRRKKR